MHRSSLLSCAMLSLALAACEPASTVEALTIDASDADGWVTLDLESGTLGDDRSAEGWDLAFQRSTVLTNGGTSGPGTVAAALLDTPDGLYDEDGEASVEAFEALDAEGTLELLLAVEAPETTVADALEGAFGEAWYVYDTATGNMAADPSSGWMVRGGEGTSYARVRVEAFDCPTRSGEGIRDFGVAIEVDTGEGFAAPVIFAGTIGAEGGARCVDFDAGAEAAVACEGTAWDLMIGFEGRDLFLRTNSGDAGDGEGGALGPYAWEALSSWASATVDPDGTDFAPWFLADTSNSVLGTQPWYAYSLEGNHLLWPNHRVYGVVRGEGEPWFAVQVLDYYDEGGASGHVSLRWVAP